MVKHQQESLPKWLQKVVQQDALQRIESAVRQAETRTSGEIVPIVVRSSTAVSLVPALGGLGALLLALAWKLYGPTGPEASMTAWMWGLVYVLAASCGFVFGRAPSVQRFIIPRWEQKRSVAQRALLEFYLAKLEHTDQGTGILLFVSLLERQAVVLADKGISQRCPPETFDELVQDLIEGARRGALDFGFETAIGRCVGVLEPFFPPVPADKNELKDYLRIKD